MLSLGATVEQIAEALGLDIEQVRQVAQRSQLKDEREFMLSEVETQRLRRRRMKLSYA